MSNEQQCRDAFEKWMKKETGFKPSFIDGEYSTESARVFYRMFKAAWQAAQQGS